MLVLPASSLAETSTFAPAADTYASSESPDTGHGDLTYLKYAPSRTAFLRFRVQGLTGPVARATLQLYAMTGSGAGGVTVSSVEAGAWDESSLVDLDAPSLGPAVGSAGEFDAGRWVNLDVTPMVSGDGEVELALTSPSGRTRAFASRESSYVPRLVVETGADAETAAPQGTDTRPGWQLRFEDDFDGTTLGPAWEPYGEDADWSGHEGNGLRVARAVTVEGGHAVITARQVGGVIESGAFTMRDPAYRLTYGRYEARVRIDPDPTETMNGVALLWNVDDMAHPWYDGEKDVWETGVDHSDWSTFVHHDGPTTQSWCDHDDLDGHALDATSWHDVALDWEPGRMQVSVDGYVQPSCVWTDPQVIADWPQRLTFQLDAMDGDLGDAVVRMEIDRVAIYERAP